MKKVISILFVLLMCASLTISCLAAEFKNVPIIDGAEFLTEDEYIDLSIKAEEVRQAYNFDVAIITEIDMSGSDATSTADDYYDYDGFGAGSNYDGILLYISCNPREYRLTTHGYGETVFNDNGIAYLESKIQPCLAENDYYGAMDVYLDLADNLLAMAQNGEPYNEAEQDTTTVLIIIGCGLLLPLVLAAIMTSSKLSKMNTAKSNDYAANYIKPGSMRLDLSRDIFLYSHITKTERPKNTSGSHTSSSGRSHGGGGGNY